MFTESGCRYIYPQITDLAELISRNGHKVVILAPYDPDVVKWNAGRGFDFAYFRPTFPRLSRTQNLQYILRSLAEIYKSDVVISFSTPTLVTGLIAATLFQKQSIYYSLELSVPGEANFELYSLFQKLLRYTDLKIFSTGPHRSEVMHSAYSLSNTPGSISCAALSKTSTTISSEKGWIPFRLRELAKTQNGITVVCDGGLSPINCFDMLLEAKIPVSSGVIIGMIGPLDSSIKPLLDLTRKETDNYFYLGELAGTRYDIINALRGTTLGIAFKRADNFSIQNDQLYTPNKLYDYFAAGVPALCSSQASLRFVAEDCLGYILSDLSATSLANFLTSLPNRTMELEKMAALITRRFQTDLNFETAAAPLLDLI